MVVIRVIHVDFRKDEVVKAKASLEDVYCDWCNVWKIVRNEKRIKEIMNGCGYIENIVIMNR